jgi:diaminohydroxyphosphoribosylaminopyrimidine deaminase/5-amino-6-(5-phosphoribosylamino)uracil reductase
VRDGDVVGEGFHERAGGPHAEIVALAAAGDASRGATAYVTLEPCAHHGRTPPCAAALVSAGVSRVSVGMPDPTLPAAGGAEALRRAGVAVDFAPDPRPFEDLVGEWLHAARLGRPFVRVKTALSLDGRPALAARTRAELTGEGARAVTMRLRAAADAVLVGTSTVSIDDPALTVRDADGRPATRQPLRVILCRTEQPSSGARILRDGLGAVVLLLPEEVDPDASLLDAGAEVVTYPIGEGIVGALASLHSRGVVSLLVEAGARMFSALWEQDLADELVLYHAGGVAGEQAPALYMGRSQEDTGTLERRMRAVEAGLAGNDAVTVWRRVSAAE